MSNITTHNNNGRTWLIVEVPEGAFKMNIVSGLLNYKTPQCTSTWSYITLPPDGNYSAPVLAGDMSESDWAEIVYKEWDGQRHWYLYYEDDTLCVISAESSGLSLLASHNLTPSTAVIIEVK